MLVKEKGKNWQKQDRVIKVSALVVVARAPVQARRIGKPFFLSNKKAPREKPKELLLRILGLGLGFGSPTKRSSHCRRQGKKILLLQELSASKAGVSLREHDHKHQQSMKPHEYTEHWMGRGLKLLPSTMGTGNNSDCEWLSLCPSSSRLFTLFYKLGPVILCKEDAHAGLAQSSFECLVLLGVKLIMLQIQYHMHPYLLELPSNNFYEGFLGIGAAVNERKSLRIDSLLLAPN
ncbi:hypothetical protein VNO77_03171 [Canavalia gladiata]|uniref:DNA2/NAM7 helicase-like C-terminal domain-containing protein n=1 Tax=Canavalia gladiata TaxID=3824 RepID=A0AAN9RBZ0_CANGL